MTAATGQRVRVAACLALVVAAGLLSRWFPLPGVLAEHTGDALYATAAFLVLRLLVPAAGAGKLAAAAFGLAAVVEAAQLLQWQWLVALRRTTPGALLLGQGFQWADFPAYAVGALLGWGLDFCLGLSPRRGPSR